ncbi:MAG: hypothetical protein WC997_08880 [Porticoccaceae bacterium]
MIRERRSSDISLTIGAGFTKPLLAIYALCALAAMSFHYDAPWYGFALAATLACLCVAHVMMLRAASGRAQLIWRSGQWLWVQNHQEMPVSCHFSYVTPWLVAAKVHCDAWTFAKYRAFVPSAATTDGWRRLQLLIRDDERSRSARQN